MHTCRERGCSYMYSLPKRGYTLSKKEEDDVTSSVTQKRCAHNTTSRRRVSTQYTTHAMHGMYVCMYACNAMHTTLLVCVLRGTTTNYSNMMLVLSCKLQVTCCLQFGVVQNTVHNTTQQQEVLHTTLHMQCIVCMYVCMYAWYAYTTTQCVRGCTTYNMMLGKY